MEVLIVALVAIIVIIVAVVKYKKNKPAPPVPPVTPEPPVTQGYFFRVAIYDENCNQKGYGLIINSVDLTDNMNKFYYNPVLRRIEQIVGVFDPDSTSGLPDFTYYTNAGADNCQEIVI